MRLSEELLNKIILRLNVIKVKDLTSKFLVSGSNLSLSYTVEKREFIEVISPLNTKVNVGGEKN